MADSLVITVPNELFTPAESSSFSGTYSIESIEFGPDTYGLVAPFTWNVCISNTGEALLVTGSVVGTVKTSCARCLEDATFDIDGEVEGYFIIPGREDDEIDMPEDEYDMLSEEGVIDLEPLLYAAVLIELPTVPLCDEECLGLCPQCGKNLNEGPCNCEPPEDFKPDNPFAVLKDMKFD